jgi:hypothetical protein
MLAGVAGNRVNDALRVALPPHRFNACTLNVPVVKVLGIFNTIDVPLLLTIVQPAGTVQT